MPPRTPSLYNDTTEPAPPTPPLNTAATTDVAIVGAGFTGLSTALHLAASGRAVTVLEAHEPGWGASGRNGGQVNPGLKPAPEAILRDHGEQLGRRMIALSHAAPDGVFDLVRKHQIRCEARQNGTLRLATSASTAAALRRLAADCAGHDMPTGLLEGDALHAATGTSHYKLGLLDRRGGDLNPLAYARGLTRAAQHAGATIHGQTPVTTLRRTATGWTLETPGATLTANQVLLATNGYTTALWPGLQRSVIPVYSAIAASAPMPDALARTVLPLRASVFETGRITVYYRVDEANRLILGGRGPMRDLAGPEPLAYLIRHAERLWPGLKGLAWTHGWSGQLAMTRDHTPHIHDLAPGPHAPGPHAPGLVACLGYNGRGVAMATAMGQQLTRHLAGHPIDMPVTPLRPIRFHRLWPLAVKGAILNARLMDKLGR